MKKHQQHFSLILTLLFVAQAAALFGQATQPSPYQIQQNGATTNQVLLWNGTNWGPSAVSLSSSSVTGVLPSANGGTGVNNGTNTLTMAGNVVHAGAFAVTITATGATSVTLPTSGTLVNTAVTTLSSLSSIGTVTTGTWNATAIGPAYGGTGLTTVAQGDLLYGSALNTWSTLAKSSTGTRYLSNTGTSNNPAWAQIDMAAGVTGTLGTANGGTGLSSIGSANYVLGVNTGATGLEYKQLIAGSNVTITPGAGSITIAASPGAGGYSTIQNAGVSVTTRTTLNIINNGLVAADDGTSKTTLSLSTSMSSLAGLTLTAGDLIYAASGSSFGNLADVAVGRVLVSGGAGVAPAYSATPTLGVNGTTAGTLSLANATASGASVTIQNNATTTTGWNFNLPSSAGTAGQPLLSGGGGSTAMTWGTLGVAAGGTGITSGTSGGVPYFSGSTTIASSAALTANAIVLGGGAGAAPSTPVGLGTTTTVLHGNAAGAPSWGAVALGSDVSGTLGATNGGTAQSTWTTGDILYASGTNTLTKLAIGTAGQVLTVSGSVPVWSSTSSISTQRSYTESSTLTTIDLSANVGNVKDKDGNNVAFTIPSDLNRFVVIKNGIILSQTGTGTTRDYSITGNTITFSTALLSTDRVVYVKF